MCLQFDLPQEAGGWLLPHRASWEDGGQIGAMRGNGSSVLG